jgi:hypothetical protein
VACASCLALRRLYSRTTSWKPNPWKFPCPRLALMPYEVVVSTRMSYSSIFSVIRLSRTTYFCTHPFRNGFPVAFTVPASHNRSPRRRRSPLRVPSDETSSLSGSEGSSRRTSLHRPCRRRGLSPGAGWRRHTFSVNRGEPFRAAHPSHRFRTPRAFFERLPADC